MKYSGQFTIDSLNQPILSAFLATEPSARRRSASVVRYAELGCMIHKLVQSGLIDARLAALPLIQESGQSAACLSQTTDQLTNQLLDNIFGDFSFSSSDLQDAT